MNIDIQKVINKLAEKVGKLEVDNVILTIQNAGLVDEIEKLKEQINEPPK